MAYTNGINRIEIKGVITTDIQKIEKNGDVIGCKFMIGVNRKQTKKEAEAHAQLQSDYIPCTAWSWTAKHILDKYEKRSPIFIIGQWTSGSYIDRDGKKVFTTEVLVDRVQIAETRKQRADYPSNGTSYTLAEAGAHANEGFDVGEGGPEITADDMPF